MRDSALKLKNFFLKTNEFMLEMSSCATAL